MHFPSLPANVRARVCTWHSNHGLWLGDTNGLVSTPARLFLSKHASRRARAAVLPSNGTRSVAPSPRTSRTSAVLNLSLIERSISTIVTAFDSGNAFVSTNRDPATSRIVYALPGSSFHFCDWRNNCKPSRVRRKSYINSLSRAAHGATVELVSFVRGADSPWLDRDGLLLPLFRIYSASPRYQNLIGLNYRAGGSVRWR